MSISLQWQQELWVGESGKSTDIIFLVLISPFPQCLFPLFPDQEGLSTNTESQTIDFSLGGEYAPGHSCDFTDFSDPEKLD